MSESTGRPALAMKDRVPNSGLQKGPGLVLGGIAVVVLLAILPRVLQPSGMLGALLLFCSGMTFGVLLLLCLGVFLFLKFGTAPLVPHLQVSPDATAVEVDATRTSPDMDALTPAERQALYESVVQEMIRNAGSPAPPHTFAMDGRYAGWLWAIPGSRYDRSEALANWPPPAESPRPMATRWWAHLQGSSLLLARTSQLEHSDRVPVVCVSLAGCSLELVTDGLRGKTRWWRKAPLELSHAERPLLGNERSVMLFAAGSAAKEQWFTVLRRAAGVDGGTAIASEAMYAQFCERVRAANGAFVYPQEADISIPTAAGQLPEQLGKDKGGSPQKAQKGRGGAWGRWWSRRDRNASPEPSARGSSPKPELRERKSRDMSPKKQRKLPEDAPLPGFLSPQQMETAWMGSKKDAAPRPLAKMTSQGSAVPPLKERDRDADKSGRAVSLASADASSHSASGHGFGPSLEDMSASLPDAPASSSSAHLQPIASMPAVHVADYARTAASGRPDAAAACRRPVRSGPAASEPSAAALGRVSPAPPTTAFYEDAVKHSPAKPAAGPDAEHAPGEAPQHAHHASSHASAPAAAIPLGLPTETAVNMLLARGAFDLLRSEEFKAKIRAHVQKKMNELRLPDFIHSIDCLDIDIGSSVPHISNLRALPTPDAVIWPQVMFDLEYEGSVKIVIETKLHMRDHAMWSQLDQAITRVAGAVDESASPADSEDESYEPAVSGSKSEPPKPALTDLSAKPAVETAQSKRRLMDVSNMRRKFAEGIRQIAEVTADRVARMQLRMELEIRSLKGPIVAWVPPPPGDRLWFSFVTPPELVADAHPQVSGRMLKYVAQAGRVSQFIASKLQSSIAKNMLFPSCSDIKLPHLLPSDDPAAAMALPSFLSALQSSGDDDSSHKARLKLRDSRSTPGSSPPVTPSTHGGSQSVPEDVPVARLPKRGSSLQPRRSTADQLRHAPPDSRAATQHSALAGLASPVRQHDADSAPPATDAAHPTATSAHVSTDATPRGDDLSGVPVGTAASPARAAADFNVEAQPAARQFQQPEAGSADVETGSGLQIRTAQPATRHAPAVSAAQPPELSADAAVLADPLGASTGHLLSKQSYGMPQQQQQQPQQQGESPVVERVEQQQFEPRERQLPAAKQPSLPRHASLPADSLSQDGSGRGRVQPSHVSSSQDVSQPGSTDVVVPGRYSSSADAEPMHSTGSRQSRSVPTSTDASPAGDASRKGTWFQMGQKHLETFKNRNPNTMQQGMKLAGQVASWREQAQERMRTAMQAREAAQAGDKLATKQQ